MKYKTYIVLLFAIITISIPACKIGKVHKLPEMEVPQSFDTQGLEEGVAADIGWSTLYSDSILQKLIATALEYNKDMLIATARIKEMAAAKRIKFAGIFPEIGAQVSGDREYLNHGGSVPKYASEQNVRLTFGWELDLWGNLRWQNEAGISAYMQSVEAQRALRLTIISQVAQDYFELKALDRKYNIVAQTVEARKAAVHFAKLRYEGGLTSEIPYRQSLVELARTEAMIPKLENEIKLKENGLSLLLGKFPAEIQREQNITRFAIAEDLPIDIPSSLLKRRPDVRLAEQQLREANAKVGVALTDMFPRIRLTGSAGVENDELANFLKSPAWYILGSITEPVFSMGKKNATHRAAQAAYEQEVFRYEQKVLEVFREVNNAITAFRKTKEMYHSTETLYQSANSYHELALLQYINGVISYMDVLDSQRQLFDAEIALNDALLDQLNATVQLYKALGGGVNQ
ncbi:MAG: efflux transporter outer membrane subunit [Bacteroidales bacterium]|jgi:multidrug efflux system outer membrane protein|nr:efflux transporter outer membrane subunit [Bacteroidales bacterium]